MNYAIPMDKATIIVKNATSQTKPQPLTVHTSLGKGLTLNVFLHVKCQMSKGHIHATMSLGFACVGKTSRALKTCITHICNHDPSSPVAVHFTKARHNISTLRYIGIESVHCPQRLIDFFFFCGVL